MRKRLRVFISSPGDVPDERLRADLAIDKLAQEYSRFFSIEAYRWEHEPMLASGHFQDAIEPPSAFDIVILILWSRLGTELPAKTQVREYKGLDGRTPVTGTEWEYEEALAGARAHGAPDILAFRNESPTSIDPLDAGARAMSLAQLDALQVFWSRHFADRGMFVAAYDGYRTLEDFSERLERSLRKLIERRIVPDPTAAPIWLGAPFRGLQAYEFEHAAIFFGRDGLVAKAAEQLAMQARAGSAFLLISGASGSGKSSLVRAALVPRLMKPQRIKGISFLRRATFRPGDAGDDIVRGLVVALIGSGEKNVGVPELLAPGQDADTLATFLRNTVDHSGFLLASALARVTEAGRNDGRLLAYESANLVLVIDQLEELFTGATIPPEDRTLFIRLLGALARSGSVWIIATLRADFWHRAAEMPELVALAEGAGRLDVAPPSPSELAEMIRKPAQTAGISFEAHPDSNIGLDAALAQDAAAEPGVLPLLSFTLDALYAQDVIKAGGRQLTYATYAALGSLEGAIATRADDVVDGLPPPAQAALPRVLRQLVTAASGTDHVAVARGIPLDTFPPGSDSRRLVDALTAARLLVASSEGVTPTVRLAHEALIRSWGRARDHLINDRRDLETRALVERQYQRWKAASGAMQRQLLLRDPDLANALDWSERWGEDVDAETRAFVQASRRFAQRRQQMTTIAASVFALVAVVAVIAAWTAIRFETAATRNFALAVAQADTLVSAISSEVQDFGGISKDTVRRILLRIEKQFDEIASTDRDNPRLLLSRARMLSTFVENYLNLGDLPEAARRSEECESITRALVARAPDNFEFLDGLARCLERRGDTLLPQAHLNEGLAALGESMQIKLRIAPSYASNAGWLSDLSRSFVHVGRIMFYLKNIGTAVQAFQGSLELRRKQLADDPSDTALQRDVAESLAFLGFALSFDDKPDEALAAAQESVQLSRTLLQLDRENVAWRGTYAHGLIGLGNAFFRKGRLDESLAALNESTTIARTLATLDQGNAASLADLSGLLGGIGYVLDELGKHDDSLSIIIENLSLQRRLLALSPDHLGFQLNLAVSYSEVGTVQFERDDYAASLSAFQESTAMMRKVNERAKNNAYLQDTLATFEFGVALDLLALSRDDEAAGAFDDTLPLMPERSLPYLYRAITEVYAGHLDRAIEDLLTSDRLDPLNIHSVIWLHIARTRAGQESRQVLTDKAAKVTSSEWPMPILSLYLGSGTPEAVRKAALTSADVYVQTARKCEAEFFIAIHQLETGTRENAKQTFDGAYERCASHQLSYRAAAKFELQRLGR